MHKKCTPSVKRVLLEDVGKCLMSLCHSSEGQSQDLTKNRPKNLRPQSPVLLKVSDLKLRKSTQNTD